MRSPLASATALLGGSELRPLIRQERADLLALLRTLTPAEWDAQSLCGSWRVRDVAAHLLHDSMPAATYLADGVRGRGSLERINAVQVDRASSWSTEELLSRVEESVNGGLGAALLPRLSFVDLVIHQQDIRRPLGRVREIPSDRLLALLDNPDPFTGAPKRMAGLRLVATDAEWQHGHGPEVRGPGEALAMSLAGRAAALTDLAGDGLEVLSGRVRS
ncbi:maleylpyruvate isomerase family mycothiol-dependent enzyme [Nocardia sp. NBC_00511]|uniref:maleylpyruvate isomerase family mycothiol-dependent enzyme n=1 Tax=Nocardia sp. NBC_00511 TaxID=2903591 RepID=UPI0030E39FDB